MISQNFWPIKMLEGLIGDNVDSTNSLIENLEVIPGYEKALDALLETSCTILLI